jgi:aspartyl-tRNA(Asn)/glutamyl-tRNA(Gln) amidotransferase subunit A
VTPEVLATIDATAAALRAAGATVEDVVLPDFLLFSICGRVIMMAEAFAIHEADMQERPQLYGRITFERFVLGAAITAADLMQAMRVRRELTEAVDGVLQRYDALLTASGLAPAPRFDAPANPSSAATPMQTIPFNVTGHPAMSVPTALSPIGLPLGVQVVGRPFDEAIVLRVARAIEMLSGWEKVAFPA